MLRLPNVYTILPGIPFARALAMQLWEEYKHDLPGLSDVQIYLPNRRSVRALADMFLQVSDGQATLLPRLTPLGDIDEDDLLESDPFILDEDPFLTPAIPTLERQILLSKLILARQDIHFTSAEAFRLAGELAGFLDRAHTEQIDLGKIDDLVTGELASHWQVTRDFLSIIVHQWPQYLADNNLMDPVQRRNVIFEKKIASLRRDPPNHRVIAAGSTGSIPATAALLDVIARLPNGCVILPGFDPAIDEEKWHSIDEMHPYFYQKRLIELMELDRKQIKIWPGHAASLSEKLRLSHFAMQSQNSFDLSDALIDGGKLTGMDFIAAENPLHEAKIIALSLRDVLNSPDKTAMVVTPDRVLAQHIQQEMQRWDITVNDSGGMSLSHTPIGLFLKIITNLAAEINSSTDILSLMRQPFFRLHGPEANRQQEISALDIALRQNFLPENSLHAFARQNNHPILNATLAALQPVVETTRLPLHEWIELHIHVAETLASTTITPGADILWRFDDGQAASQLLAKLHQASASHALTMDAADYKQFFDTALQQVTIRPRYGTHPRLRILSAIEARLQDADLVILAGTNEGVWPAAVKADNWLSRPMQQQMGFGSSDRRIGQSALDFMTLFCAKDVRITWSKKREGIATPSSRWLQQIFAVLKKNGIEPASNASPYYRWALTWDEPQKLAPQPAPSFAPPIDKRPRSLSVTRVETWRKDPYALYARYVLNLVPLDPLDRLPAARDWGNAAHTVLESFFSEQGFSQPDPARYFDTISARVMADYPLNKAQEKSWSGRLTAIRNWILDNETADAQKIRTEVTLRHSWTLPDGSAFELHGRADRIDEHNGAIVITDYKTGSLPSDIRIKKGLAPQLPLLGLLTEAQNVNLRYIKLNGKTANPAEEKLLKDPQQLIEQNKQHFHDLLTAYYGHMTPYTAQALPSNDYDDYRHLKRVAEWAALDQDDDAEDTA